MATTAQVFYCGITAADQTLTGATTIKQIVTTAPATTTTTTLTWTTTTVATETVIPQTATSTASDTSNNNGWVFNNSTGGDALVSTAAAQRVIPAGTWTFNASLTFTAPALLATASATLTAKVYRVATGGGARTLLFSTAFAASTATAAQTNAVSATSAAQPQYTLADGEVIMIGWIISSAATANALNQVTNNVITFVLGSAGGKATVPTPGVRTQYNNPTSDAVSGTDVISRVASHPRIVTDAVSGTDATTRAGVYNRATSDSLTTSEAVSRAASHPRTTTEALTTTDVTSRVVSSPRTLTDSLTTSDVVVRAFTGSRTIADTLSTSDSVARALIYGRFTYEYPQGASPDYTVQFPTKHVAGFVRNSDGTVFYGGASIQLIRDSDNKVVQTTVSSTIDGSYSFVRDLYDPNTYHVAAFYPSAPEQGVTQTGLVPV